MHADGINQQAQGRVAHATGAQGAQEGILHPDQGKAQSVGDGLATNGGAALAPDNNAV